MNKDEIKAWLDHYGIGNYTINDDLTVDVNETVNLSDFQLNEISVQFNNVHGSFLCSKNKLTSLKGCPRVVDAHFHCYENKLTSLEYSPSIVTGRFWCCYNKLTSLKGLPSMIRHLSCHNNKLTSLKYLPIWCEILRCDNNLKDTNEYKTHLLLKALRK